MINLKPILFKYKRILLLLWLILSEVGLSMAYDVIAFRNGDIIDCSVIEISSTEIKYRKKSNPRGPLYTVLKSDVLSIKYENGETDKFEVPEKQNSTIPSISVALPYIDNDDIKNTYSIGTYSSSKNITSSPAKAASFFLKFTDQSVVSSKELSVKFEPGYCIEGKWYPVDNKTPGYLVKRIANIQYRIHLTNKTEQPIFLDLGQSSKQDEINGYLTYYDGSQTVNSTGNLNGAAANLGLVTIGGASSESTTVIQNGNRVVRISPYSTYIIPSKKKFLPSYREPYEYYETFTNYEEVVPFARKLSDLKERETKYYSESESPIQVNYKLTYAYNESFDKPIEMNFSLYAFQIIGLPLLFDKWWGTFRDTFKNFKGLDDTFIGGSVMFEK